ncbi:hypothetical protein WN944_029168 [Citrus x changshan-huyou]|uniref:Uncharacterized protein n=1 Tax=Citrus x changshan-huyou TaxID=2935761 RepID=A0AAP0LS20_9ROSI
MLQPATADSDPDYIGVRRLLLFRKAESGVRRRLAKKLGIANTKLLEYSWEQGNLMVDASVGDGFHLQVHSPFCMRWTAGVLTGSNMEPNPNNDNSTNIEAFLHGHRVNLEELEQDGDNDVPKKQRKRRRTSKAWGMFTKLPLDAYQDGKERSMCVCGKVYISESNYGTGNMLKHIKKCPKLKKPRDPRQMILDHSGSIGSCSSKFDQVVFRELLSAAIVKHGLPFQFVEFDAIRTCFEFLNSEVQNISRNTTKADILKAYNAERLRIKAMLEEAIKGAQGKVYGYRELFVLSLGSGREPGLSNYLAVNLAGSGNMVTRMESRVEFVEEVVTSVQGELGAIKQELQKIPNMEQGIAALMEKLDQVVQTQEDAKRENGRFQASMTGKTPKQTDEAIDGSLGREMTLNAR